jgi:hypothetical protein
MDKIPTPSHMVEELIKFHFSDALQSGYQAYRTDCWNYYSDNLATLEETKKQLLESFSDTGYDWKEITMRNGFFRYHNLKTKEELLLDLMVLCWDLFFPEVVLSVEEKESTKKHLHQLLKKQIGNANEIEFKDVLFFLHKNNRLKKQIDRYHLITLFYDPNLMFTGDQIIWGFYRETGTSWRMYSEIGNDILKLDHELGTDKWYISLADREIPPLARG